MKPVRTLAALVAGGLATLACTTTKGVGPDEARTTPAPAPTSSIGIAQVAPAPIVQENGIQTTDPPPARPPSGKLAIGDACKPADVQHCGTKGRIAMVVQVNNMPIRKRDDVPCEMQPIPRESFGDHGSGCVKDDRVYLGSDCMECRIYSRWEMTGLVAEMTEKQLVDAQRRVGLAAEPVLRTPDAWRTALASAARGRRRP
jgi:hypothetical protein